MASSFLFTLLHELGHAALGSLFGGGRGWVIHMGAGRLVFDTKKLKIYSRFFHGGKISFSEGPQKRYQMLLRVAGGPLTNILCNIFILYIAHMLLQHFSAENPPPWWLDRVFVVALFTNIWIIFYTMIPIKYRSGAAKGLQSDGLTIYQLICEPEKFQF